MKRKKNLVAIVATVLMFFVPMFSMAQIFTLGDLENQRDGTEGGYLNTWDEGNQVIDPTTGQEYAPVGDGLWLLVAAAGLYLLVKSKKSRKAATAMMAGLALTLGFAQCSKPNESENYGENQTPAGETIFIRLNASSGKEAKTDISVLTGRITWNSGDKVYVACNNAIPTSKSGDRENAAILLGGCLEVGDGYNQSVESPLSGEVIVPGGYNLPQQPVFTFYYVGKGVAFADEPGSTSLTFNIADQNGHNGVSLNDAGEYMIGRTVSVTMQKNEQNEYVPTPPTGDIVFKSLTSVMWLDTSDFGDGLITTSGDKSMKEMTINLSAPETPSYTQGSIAFPSGDNVQISVLPATPDSDNHATIYFNGNNIEGSLSVLNGIQPGKVYARVQNNVSALQIVGTPIPETSIPEGALPGLFTVEDPDGILNSGDERKIYFSKGNLWYLGNADGSGTWRFADNQWDYLGNGTSGNVSISGYSGYNSFSGENQPTADDKKAARDLFGWGTSGWDNGNSYFYPYSTAYPSSTANGYGYGPLNGSDYDYNLTGRFANADWGVFNTIRSYSVDDNYTKTNGWRTLSSSEFGYLVNLNNPSGLYGMGKVGTACGLILLPDNWDWNNVSLSEDAPTWTPGKQSDWSKNNYTISDWKKMEQKGAVFLPAAGNRTNSFIKTGSACYYWTSTVNSGSTKYYSFYFLVDPTASSNNCKLIAQRRSCACSVRLVKDVPNGFNGGSANDFDPATW